MSNEATLSGVPLPESSALQALPARLWVILGGLRATIAAWGGRDRAAVPLVVLVYGRVGRIAQRFAALVAHLVAGTLPPSRVRASSPARADARQQAEGTRAASVRLPGGSAWLVRRLQESVAFGSQLQAMLDDPAMAALLAACPRAERMLRPLRRMLGLAKPGAPVRDPKPMVVRKPAPAAWPAAWSAAPAAEPVAFPTGRPPPGWPPDRMR